MNAYDINRFFRKLGVENVETIKPYFDVLEAFSRIVGFSFYVVDYFSRGFVYVSKNPLFLCGYTAEEVQSMGYSFYKKAVVEEDLEMLMEIDKKGEEFFSSISVEDREKSVISYDYRLKRSDGNIIMVTEQNTPIVLTEDGQVRFALCIITLSIYNKPGNIRVKVENQLYDYNYSLQSKKWKMSMKVSITNRERDILLLAAQGASNREIANALFIDISTVKFHKKNIFSKFKVKNIIGAIGFAYNNKLF